MLIQESIVLEANSLYMCLYFYSITLACVLGYMMILYIIYIIVCVLHDDIPCKFYVGYVIADSWMIFPFRPPFARYFPLVGF